MDAAKLVKMANAIASFFHGESVRPVAVAGVAGHISRFWEPRMRRELLRWNDEHEGEGLSDLVREAIATHRDQLTPKTPAVAG